MEDDVERVASLRGVAATIVSEGVDLRTDEVDLVRAAGLHAGNADKDLLLRRFHKVAEELVALLDGLDRLQRDHRGPVLDFCFIGILEHLELPEEESPDFLVLVDAAQLAAGACEQTPLHVLAEAQPAVALLRLRSSVQRAVHQAHEGEVLLLDEVLLEVLGWQRLVCKHALGACQLEYVVVEAADVQCDLVADSSVPHSNLSAEVTCTAAKLALFLFLLLLLTFNVHATLLGVAALDCIVVLCVGDVEDRRDSGDICALVEHVVRDGEKEGIDGLLGDKAEEVLVALEVLDHLLCAVAEGADGALLRREHALHLCVEVSAE